MKAVLELIPIAARIFEKERSLYYIKKAIELEEKIYEVEDSDFYKKDMEAKGIAQRQLESDVESLRLEVIREATL